MARIRIGAAQLNMVVGDVDGNAERIIAAMKQAEAERCDLIVFPELAVTGYPPEDLLLKPSFVDDNLDALQRVAAASRHTVAVVGFVDRDLAGDRFVAAPGDRVGGAVGGGSIDGGRSGDAPRLFNAAAVCVGGRVVGRYHKRRLPNYAVFDEQRYFTPGAGALGLYRVAGVEVGVSICEDAWAASGIMASLAAGGAGLIVNLNGSPYARGKLDSREAMLCERSAETSCVIVYVNQVGGQDELVFDGASLIVGVDGAVLARAPQFVETVLVIDVEVAARAASGPGREMLPRVVLSETALTLSAEVDGGPVATGLRPAMPLPEDDGRFASPARLATVSAEWLDPVAEVYAALVLGTHDYVTKNGFTDVVIGLSGGVDSSLVAAVAADALGPARVHGVLMPSRYSSDHSITDAELLAANLGIEHRTIAIEEAYTAFTAMLGPSFEGREPDLTEENLQSRIRGVVLMSLSNKFGWMVLTTSNKSESAVGYSTLYGDSAGGFAVIKDVPKLLVYELCDDRNRRAGSALIPANVLAKPPSAELRPDQRDDESLPPYEVLDPIIEAYVAQDRTVADLIEAGFDADLVRRIARLVDLAEYKRRQFPPGPRISAKAFGKDRRLPITNRYRG
jgi:NAD+ synthase (glutamine-hydrolysing)